MSKFLHIMEVPPLYSCYVLALAKIDTNKQTNKLVNWWHVDYVMMHDSKQQDCYSSGQTKGSCVSLPCAIMLELSGRGWYSSYTLQNEPS